MVGVIGTREPTQEEYNRAYNTGKTLAQRGFVVVSGLAKGLDSAAHRGALDGSGMTVAIVNTPIEQTIYPRENQQLAERIRRQGCIIHPFKERAREDRGERPTHFIKRLLERDRLLAYLCPRIIVISNNDTIKGGTRYAVHFGIEWGREVFRCNSDGKYYKNPLYRSCVVA